MIALRASVLRIAACAAVLQLAVAATGHAAPQAAPDVVRDGATVAEMLAVQQALRAWLGAEAPARPTASIHVVLTAAEHRGLRERTAGAGGAPMKIGIVRTVSPAIAIAARERSSVSIAGDGARGLRVHVTGMELPPDAAMYFYADDGDEAYGPFSGRGPDDDGEFWTPSIRGAHATLLVLGAGTGGRPLVVDGVGYLGDGTPMAVEQAGTSFCGNPTCIIDASCTTAAAVTDAMSAIAQLEWVSGPFLYTCTGGLLADTDAGSQIPYLLTANHCLNRAKDAKSLEAFFFYRTAACGGACPANDGFPKTLGATIKATGTAGDYTLLQLSQSPPAGTVMLGWNSTPIAFTNGADLYRISHPNFGPQTFAQHQVDTSASTCTGWPRGERIYSRDVIGATDGGSSGSPVVNAAGQVVGQLSGGCGFNVSDVCDAASNATVDGALAYYFGSVAKYLDPTPCTPVAEVCSDGIDNDCDGAVDCTDADCAGSASCATCAPVGTACTANGQCCSSSCKGKPGQKTCK